MPPKKRLASVPMGGAPKRHQSEPDGIKMNNNESILWSRVNAIYGVAVPELFGGNRY